MTCGSIGEGLSFTGELEGDGTLIFNPGFWCKEELDADAEVDGVIRGEM